MPAFWVHMDPQPIPYIDQHQYTDKHAGNAADHDLDFVECRKFLIMTCPGFLVLVSLDLASSSMIRIPGRQHVKPLYTTWESR